MRARQILFIHGAGDETFILDQKQVDSLNSGLNGEYEIIYPHMPNADDPKYAEWKERVISELNSMDDNVILVGHSLGGSVLMKVLAEEKVEKSISGLFLIATPYWGANMQQFALYDNFADHLPKGLLIYLYHSQDDNFVPVSHMTKYSEKLPNAITRALDGRGHQLGNDLTEVAADISKL